MGYLLKALIWAATNQGNLLLIVQAISNLVKAYVSLRQQLIASGTLTPSQASAYDAAVFETLSQEAATSSENLDAMIARLKRQEPP